MLARKTNVIDVTARQGDFSRKRITLQHTLFNQVDGDQFGATG
jgi:hypothetical protein